VSLGCYELEKHKPFFKKGFSKLSDHKDPREINGDNLNDVRCEASRNFRKKKWEYLKDKINEIAKNGKKKNIKDLHRGINEFKRGYQCRKNLLKDENCDLLAYPTIF
jgi:hypothetical protein